MPRISITHLPQVSWSDHTAHAFDIHSAIDTWRIHTSLSVDFFTDKLLPEELEKMDRFLRLENRLQFAVSRGALRYLSGKYLHLQPQSLILDIDENKKPYWQNIKENILHFNVAHSGDYVLISFAGSDIGVDVERINNSFEYDGILPACFNTHEINEIRNATDPQILFYTFWTRKEALIKATSKGIDNDLPAIPCIDGTWQMDNALIGSEKNWAIKSFAVDEGYTGSMAHDPSVNMLRFLNFSV